MIAAEGNRLSHVANGQIRTDAKAALADRLVRLDDALGRGDRRRTGPTAPAVRGGVRQRQSAIDAEARPGARRRAARARRKRGLEVGEYAPRLVKKAVVGTGGGGKGAGPCDGRSGCCPAAKIAGADAADALAVAITHAHHLAERARRGAAGGA